MTTAKTAPASLNDAEAVHPLPGGSDLSPTINGVITSQLRGMRLHKFRVDDEKRRGQYTIKMKGWKGTMLCCATHYQ